jgi:hypothetical protein
MLIQTYSQLYLAALSTASTAPLKFEKKLPSQQRETGLHGLIKTHILSNLLEPLDYALRE